MTPEARTAQTLEKLDSLFAANVRRVLNAMQAIGAPMVAYDGYRTPEQQQKLYAQGRTTPGRIVTHADGVVKRSKHQDRLAVDCAFVVITETGWTLRWQGPWPAYMACAEAVGLVAGGRWTSPVDHPHLEARP